jgi:hypothetical protein
MVSLFICTVLESMFNSKNTLQWLQIYAFRERLPPHTHHPHHHHHHHHHRACIPMGKLELCKVFRNASLALNATALCWYFAS